MDDIHDIRTRNKNRCRLTLACARALEDLPYLQGDDPAYRLYMQVPTTFLGSDADPEEKGSIDLLLCRASDGLAASAFVFDIDTDSPEIPDRLDALRLRRVGLLGATQAMMKEIAAYVLKEASALPGDPGELSGSLRLDTCPLAELLAREGRNLKEEELIQGQLLRPDGSVTDYGSECRLVLRRVRRNGAWTSAVDVLAGKSDRILKALRFSRETLPPSQFPLQDRMEAMKNGVPADSAYPAHMADLLDRLLAANIEHIWNFNIMSRIGKAFPGDDGLERSATYGGALGMVHDLLHRFLEGGWEDETLYGLADSMMAQLLRWLRRGDAFPLSDGAGQQSISQRLSNIHGMQERALIASAPMFGYLQGASAWLGSEYPCMLFRSWSGSSRLTVDHLGKWITELRDKKHGSEIDRDRPMHIPDAFFYMYSFLVEPFCPDIDVWNAMNEP